MDPANEFAFGAEAVRCHACAAIDRAQRKTPEGMDSAGINWISTRKGCP